MAAHETLAELSVGSRAVLDVPRLDVARTRRLAELGLRAGTEVRILQRTPGGGRVLAVEDTRIAVDRDLLAALPVKQPSTGTRP